MVLWLCWICSLVYIWCYVHVVYVVLCTYGVVCMLYMWFYVRVVSCSWLCMSWCVHVWHVVLCKCHACGVFVYLVLCTSCVGDVVYMWCCVHIVQVVLCTGGIVCMSYMLICVCGVLFYVHCVIVVLWHVNWLCCTLGTFMYYVVNQIYVYVLCCCVHKV